jgi:hypothetical protein
LHIIKMYMFLLIFFSPRYMCKKINNIDESETQFFTSGKIYIYNNHINDFEFYNIARQNKASS